MPSTAENALFSARAYEMLPGDKFRQKIGDRWRPFPVDSRLRENTVTGFRARVYHNEAMTEVVIAFAGTHLNDRGDWGAIWAMANGHEPPQFSDALVLYQWINDYLLLRNNKTDILILMTSFIDLQKSYIKTLQSAIICGVVTITSLLMKCRTQILCNGLFWTDLKILQNFSV